MTQPSMPPIPGSESPLAFKRILLATDFAESSTRATEYAIWLCRLFNAELVIVHAWEIPIFIGYSAASGKLLNDLESEARAELERVRAHAAEQGARTVAAFRVGLPWSEILDVVDDTKPDLVVVGTHGRRALKHAFLGSVAEKITRLSPVPVLVIRTSDPRKT